MKYDVIKGCVIKGTPHQAGEVVEIDDITARGLMGIGRVAPHSEEKKLEDRSIGLSDEQPKPKKRAKK